MWMRRRKKVVEVEVEARGRGGSGEGGREGKDTGERIEAEVEKRGGG